jgi:hypothetical protein
MSLAGSRHDAKLPRTSIELLQLVRTGVVIEGPLAAHSLSRRIIEPITFAGDL